MFGKLVWYDRFIISWKFQCLVKKATDWVNSIEINK